MRQDVTNKTLKIKRGSAEVNSHQFTTEPKPNAWPPFQDIINFLYNSGYHIAYLIGCGVSILWNVLCQSAYAEQTTKQQWNILFIFSEEKNTGFYIAGHAYIVASCDILE